MLNIESSSTKFCFNLPLHKESNNKIGPTEKCLIHSSSAYHSSFSTLTVVSFLNVVTGTWDTKVYSLCTQSSSSVRRRARRTRTRNGTLLKIDYGNPRRIRTSNRQTIDR